MSMPAPVHASQAHPAPIHPALTIRKALSEDVPAIAQLTQAAFTQYAQQVGLPITSVSALGETLHDVQQALHTKHVLVALQGEEIVGSVRYEALGGVGYLSRFGVDPRLQQGGVGKALVQAVNQGCLSLGLPAVTLHTAARITYLVRFYYSNGYFIHSTTQNKGYIRALFVNELCPGTPYNLTAIMGK